VTLVNRTRAHTSQQTRAQLVVGVGFDHRNITVALVDERARVLARQQAETPQRTTRAAATTITKLILGACLTTERGDGVIRAIGVSVPGQVDPSTGRVSISGLKNWTRIALAKMIEEGLSESGYDIRNPLNERRARAQPAISSQPAIAIQPHICCAAAAEGWVGGARGKNNVVYLSIGEAIEAGILADGRVLQGAAGMAGWAGWMGLSEHFKPEYSAHGCLATEATIGSFVRRAIDEWGGSEHSMLGKIIKADPMQLDAAIIIRAARGGDPLALKVVNETCRWIGRGIANLIAILNPEAVVIGGKLGLSLKPYFDLVREEVERWGQPDIYKNCRIVSASLGDDAVLLGAARLAWHRSS
jgi:predicted NBD/HSP70 family sugar kinase